MLCEERKKHIPSPPQAFHLFSVVIPALLFPFWDKRTVGGEGVFIKVFDMGYQIAPTIPNVKPSIIVKFLAVYDSLDCKIGLMIPTNLFALVLPFTVLLFIQNAEQPVSQSKAQIGVSVIQLPVIKGRMFRKANRKYNTVWLFLGGYFLFLPFRHNYFQMVICRVFSELFFKIGSAVMLPQNRKLGVLQIHTLIINGRDLIFVRSDINRIALTVEVTHGMKLF